MPELPEVERGRGLAESVAAGRRIVKIACAPDPIVFQKVSRAAFSRALVGRKVRRVKRWGKHIWFELDRRPFPCFHFGMSGGFRSPQAPFLRLRSSGKSRKVIWPPRYMKIHLWFDDGGELAMTDARRLGRIRLRNDPINEPPISLLGFDALLNLPPPTAFVKLVQSRIANIKALLLDQSFAAGVGNWIADEVLFQTQIDPRRRASSLAVDEAKRLRAKLKSIITFAVRVNADYNRFPDHWLFHHRWGRNADAITSRRGKIRHDTIAGRTTAWVPEVQR